MQGYFEFLISFAVLAAIVIAIGRVLARKIGFGSERRRLHGVFVLWWSICGFVLGGVTAPLLSSADTSQGYAGMAGFGLLLGWLIGTAYGFIVLAIRPGENLSRDPRKQ